MGENDMKEMDCVEVTVEKKKYVKEGIHLGMQGWICHVKSIDGHWLVNFPQFGEKDDIAEVPIKEEDLKVIPVMNAVVNEQIKAQFEEADSAAKAFNVDDNDLSGYLV